MAAPGPARRRTTRPALSAGARRCRQKFLRFFPGGFNDETYLDWERNYKEEAHRRWTAELSQPGFAAMLKAREYAAIAGAAVRIESRTNLLFSFEKMALRDAVKTPGGAKAFAVGLYDFIYGGGREKANFERWCEVVANLPRRQTRVLTWPVVTVFGFLARPDLHVFCKPNVTKIAAKEYGFDFRYLSRPNWESYSSLLEFADRVWSDVEDLQPRDMIDIQSYIWVQGSDEYEE